MATVCRKETNDFTKNIFLYYVCIMYLLISEIDISLVGTGVPGRLELSLSTDVNLFLKERVTKIKHIINIHIKKIQLVLIYIRTSGFTRQFEFLRSYKKHISFFSFS